MNLLITFVLASVISAICLYQLSKRVSIHPYTQGSQRWGGKPHYYAAADGMICGIGAVIFQIFF